MLGQQRPKGSMFQMVTIEELVPKDHFLRQLDAAVDFSFIRERVRHLYCEDNGRSVHRSGAGAAHVCSQLPL